MQPAPNATRIANGGSARSVFHHGGGDGISSAARAAIALSRVDLPASSDDLSLDDLSPVDAPALADDDLSREDVPLLAEPIDDDDLSLDLPAPSDDLSLGDLSPVDAPALADDSAVDDDSAFSGLSPERWVTAPPPAPL